jgi:hypothetical protein
MTYDDATDRIDGGGPLLNAVGRIDFELIRPADQRCYDDSLAVAIGQITNAMIEALPSGHAEMMLDAFADLGRIICGALYSAQPRPETMARIARIYVAQVAGLDDSA